MKHPILRRGTPERCAGSRGALRAGTLMAVAAVGLSGCSTLGPIPESPEATITVLVESVPSGADVYAVESDGKLGARLGRTPCEVTFGLARSHWMRGDQRVEPGPPSHCRAWGPGAYWVNTPPRRLLVTHMACMLNGGEHVGSQWKTLWSSTEPVADRKVYLTIPLVTRESAIAAAERPARARAMSAGTQRRSAEPARNEGAEIGMTALRMLLGVGAHAASQP